MNQNAISSNSTHSLGHRSLLCPKVPHCGSGCWCLANPLLSVSYPWTCPGPTDARSLPPSLSLLSPQAVSMDVSQPAPLQPSWQTQCHPFRSRVHLPFPLHKPGQPSARQSGESRAGAQEQLPPLHSCSSACLWDAFTSACLHSWGADTTKNLHFTEKAARTRETY